MGQPYIYAENFVKQQSDAVFVEIGSERGEGSTLFLANLAKNKNTVLHTVDIVEQTINHPALIKHVAHGSKWAQEIFPRLNQKISCLYLDNFDWIWDTNNKPDWIHKQIEEYRAMGLSMNNLNCQQEHYGQLLALEPFFAEHCVIIFDDTIIENGTWTGKNAPGMFYLQHRNFKIQQVVTGGAVLVRDEKT